MARAASFDRAGPIASPIARERAVAGALSGAAAGVAFVALSMTYAAIAAPGLWAPPRMIATILGFEMAPDFAAVPVLGGLALHMALSAGYGAVFAIALAGRAGAVIVAAGVVFALVLYAVNFHLFAELEHFAAFRMMAGHRFEIAVHGTYGLLLGAGLAWWRGEPSLDP